MYAVPGQKLKPAIGKQDSFAVKQGQVLLVKRWSISKAKNRLSQVAILKLSNFGERPSATEKVFSVNAPIYSGKKNSEIVDTDTTY